MTLTLIGTRSRRKRAIEGVIKSISQIGVGDLGTHKTPVLGQNNRSLVSILEGIVKAVFMVITGAISQVSIHVEGIVRVVAAFTRA